jgi:hypothetical protein
MKKLSIKDQDNAALILAIVALIVSILALIQQEALWLLYNH